MFAGMMEEADQPAWKIESGRMIAPLKNDSPTE